MRNTETTPRRVLVLVLVSAGASLLLLQSGCVSSATRNGALIGAGTGLSLGAGTGALVSSQALLGSERSKRKGDVTLDVGTSTLAGAVIGGVFGGVVGAMIGRASDSDYARPDSKQSADTQLAPRAF